MFRRMLFSAFVFLPVFCTGCASTGPNRPLSPDARSQIKTVSVSTRNIRPQKTCFPTNPNRPSPGGVEGVMTSWKKAGETVDREKQISRNLDRYRFIEEMLREAFVEELQNISGIHYVENPKAAGMAVDAEFVLDVGVFGFREPAWPLFTRVMIPYLRGTALLIANPPYELKTSPNLFCEHHVTKDSGRNPIIWENTIYVSAGDKGIEAPQHPLYVYLQEPEVLRECIRKMAHKMAKDMLAPLLSE